MTKPLSETNPYLKDPILRELLIRRSAMTSSGVEGIPNSESLEDLNWLIIDRLEELDLLNEEITKG